MVLDWKERKKGTKKGILQNKVNVVKVFVLFHIWQGPLRNGRPYDNQKILCIFWYMARFFRA